LKYKQKGVLPIPTATSGLI